MEEVTYNGFSFFKNPISVQEGHDCVVSVEDLYKFMKGDFKD